MTTWTRTLLSLFGKAPAKGRTSSRRARFAPEVLEGRQLMTVTYQGGAVMPQVQVQGLYLGSDWSTNSTYNQQKGTLEGFLKSTVSGSFMDALNGAGYGVGRGSASQGIIDSVTFNKSLYLTDAAIQNTLQTEISHGWLQAPNSNRLYVVFVEDNVAVMNSQGQTSINGFFGYHTAFLGTDASGHAADVHYAVIAYPGGPNGVNGNLSTIDGMTVTASHEIAEAVTDPNIGTNDSALIRAGLTISWDDNKLGEVGDIANQEAVYLNGYAVQRISDQNDQPMTPLGAVSSRPVSFVVLSGGYLYEHTGAGWTYLSNNVSKVSYQGIDLNGRAMVDVVFNNGVAEEYHDGGTWVPLTNNVKDAEAGQGVSWVLLTNGSLLEYRDQAPYVPSSASWTTITGGVASIDAGTDRYGVNSVDYITTAGTAYELSNNLYQISLGTGVRSVSAGRMGVSEVLFSNGNAYDYREATHTTTFLASNVAQVTAGSDAAGNPMIDLLYTSGSLWEYQASTGGTSLGSGVKAISKARAGLVDVLFTNGNADEHTSSGWTGLTGGAVEAV
jgi:hypothetical protein